MEGLGVLAARMEMREVQFWKYLGPYTYDHMAGSARLKLDTTCGKKTLDYNCRGRLLLGP